MDENKGKHTESPRKGAKLNVLDLIIIMFFVFVAALAVLLTIQGFEEAASSGKKVRISYTVIIKDIDDTVYKNVFESANPADNTYKVEVGQTVTDALTGASLGSVEKLPESVPYYEFVLSTDEAGAYSAVKHQYTNHHNIIITVTAEAVYTEGTGYTVDGKRIAVGRELNLRIAGFSETGVCETINVQSEN